MDTVNISLHVDNVNIYDRQVPDHRNRNTRAALVEAADRLLARGGPEAVTLRAVAAAADVSRTAPYRHFASKDALLSAVAAANLTKLTAQMRAATDIESEPSSLFVAARVFVEFAWAHPNHYRLEFGEDCTIEPTDELVQAAAECTDYLRAHISQAQRDGVIVAGDDPDLASLLWVILHGLAQARRAIAGSGCGDERADSAALTRVLTLAFDNLAPR
ncbi:MULTISPECIES: TetR/AcrR family transcriptional regulator [unclassified Gordonia (in: high G+C Gram-positive bacteria)]|uniref:TetR/AcrR family transcriptional regulator n=1 Tax=unclassified Gordonia (in: high G+C Gram-positive bacteria) TaxID=2657482 RepID=UPI0019652768|nr:MULTISPECIES: TetR/AcrR family transcriptional regulator [unclassified Gordonia (in: high G+C Gram-positive bacteria)]MBN0975566.1 TetR/AcrR family transcriptional regulator [Gordonia sp. BP-119]MBN0985687.1 TetR/AcrR family transcriptional regulator [Gordonia sp. BP-94]